MRYGWGAAVGVLSHYVRWNNTFPGWETEGTRQIVKQVQHQKKLQRENASPNIF